MKQRPFFSRRFLLTVIVATIVVYVFGSLALYTSSGFLEKKRKQQAISQQKDAFEKLSDEEKAIQKTQEYLKGSISLIGTSERLFFSYLQRKFDLPKELGTEGTPIDPHEDPRTYPGQINFLMRIAYPDKLADLPIKEDLDDPAAFTNVYSANCDRIPLPDNFWQTMKENVNSGGYYMAHVALALQMMEDNACHLPPITRELHDRAIEGMIELADDPDTAADLHYEAVAFLMMRGRYDAVRPEWISKIVSTQREDGGWAQKVDSDKTDFHSTLLAYWSLLEYSRPNTPDEPLILRSKEAEN